MAAFYLALWGLAAVLGATAIAALVWSIRRGEFDNLREAALSIFDEDEPPGAITDRFPASHPRSSRRP
jgi:cbb3-type cytochrome oxidase maturation protein